MEQADRPGHISGDDKDNVVVAADQLDDTASDTEMVNDDERSSKAHLDEVRGGLFNLCIDFVIFETIGFF